MPSTDILYPMQYLIPTLLILNIILDATLFVFILKPEGSRKVVQKIARSIESKKGIIISTKNPLDEIEL